MGGGAVRDPKSGYYRFRLVEFDAASNRPTGITKITTALYVNVFNDPPLVQDPIEISNNNGYDDDGYALVSSCNPSAYSIDLIRPSDDYNITMEVWEADDSGAPQSLLYNQSSGQNPGPLSPTSVINNANVYVDNWVSTYNYLLIKFTVYDACYESSQVFDQVLRVTGTPYLANFEFRYDEDEDPQGILEKVVPASTDENNPSEVGGISTALYANISLGNPNAPSYQNWSVDVSIDDQSGGWTYLGTKSGTQSVSIFSVPISSGSLIPNLADKPFNRVGKTYKITLTVSDPVCGSNSKTAYFKTTPALAIKSRVQKIKGDNHNTTWHSADLSTGQLKLHFEPNRSLKAVPAEYSLQIFSPNQTLVAQRAVTRGDNYCDLSTLARSLYIVVVVDDKGKILYRSKVIL